MKMQCVCVTAFLATVVVFAGCNQGTSGGPGAADPPVKERMGQTDDTFSLTLSSLSLKQGEVKTVPVAIKRGKNFSEDVSLVITGLPKGITFTPADPAITRDTTDMELAFTATDDAALGDFTVRVTGHPTKGADSVTEIKLTVSKLEPVDTANAAADAATLKWNEFTAAMQLQMDQFSAKFAELQESAAQATGQAKVDADLKIAEAKVKLDTASVKMNELKDASVESWEKTKEGVTAAFNDLKGIFG